MIRADTACLSSLHIHLQKIGRTIPIANGLHSAGDFVVIADVPFERLHVAAGAEQRDEMPAGRRTPNAEAFGIDSVIVGMRAQEADRGFAVFDLRGKHGMAAQAIVDTRNGKAFAQQRDRGPAVSFRAVAPAAAVNPYD